MAAAGNPGAQRFKVASGGAEPTGGEIDCWEYGTTTESGSGMASTDSTVYLFIGADAQIYKNCIVYLKRKVYQRERKWVGGVTSDYVRAYVMPTQLRHLLQLNGVAVPHELEPPTA